METDPERAALLHDSQEQVRQANDQLPPRHREVLALREVAGRSYEEIGQIMGISENAAAQLIWRARGKLRRPLTAGAVASVVAATDDCETAQLLLNRLHDGEPITDEEQEWLDEHLDECGSCRAARGMLFEVAASYRMWAPVAVLAALRPEVLTQAGAVVGADWSAVAGTGAKASGSSMAVGGTATVAVLAVAGIATISGVFKDDAKIMRDALPVPKAEAAAKPKTEPAKAKAKAEGQAGGRRKGCRREDDVRAAGAPRHPAGRHAEERHAEERRAEERRPARQARAEAESARQAHAQGGATAAARAAGSAAGHARRPTGPTLRSAATPRGRRRLHLPRPRQRPGRLPARTGRDPTGPRRRAAGPGRQALTRSRGRPLVADDPL